MYKLGFETYCVAGWPDRFALVNQHVAVTVCIDTEHVDEVPRRLALGPQALSGAAKPSRLPVVPQST